MPPWTVSSRRCNVCSVENSLHSDSDQLQLCSGCRLVRYCSADHQQLDWEIHKSFCKAIRHILKKSDVAHVMDLEGTVSSWKEFEKVLIIAKCLIRRILKRELDTHEVEFLAFPVHCQVCFSRNGKELFNCEHCEAVYYCSVGHQTEDYSNHSKWCTYLKYYYNFFELEDFNVELDFTKAPIIDPNIPNDLFSLIQSTCASVSNLTLIKSPTTLDDYQYYAAVSGFSCVATILHAINVCRIINDELDTIVVYLIGSRDEHRFLQETHCAFLCSQLPTIHQIKFYLIGPEVPQISNPVNYSIETQSHKTKIQINFQQQKFEDFTKQWTTGSDMPLDEKPHLMVSFNCGFYEYAGTTKDTWKDGIKAMLEFDRIPIVFTSYTKLEARLDFRELRECVTTEKLEYRIIVNGEENPYKDYRPFRNMELHDRKDLMYFRSGYLNILLVSNRV